MLTLEDSRKAKSQLPALTEIRLHEKNKQKKIELHEQLKKEQDVQEQNRAYVEIYNQK